MNGISHYDQETIETLKRYSEDWPKLESWLNSVSLEIVKTGYGPAEHMPNESRFSYLVTIRRNGKECQFPFYGSVNDYNHATMKRDHRAFGGSLKKGGFRPSKPSPMVYSVLACLRSDYYCPETHEEFCSEFGYDLDSIKALNLFSECRKLSRSLRAVVTADEVEAFPS